MKVEGKIIKNILENNVIGLLILLTTILIIWHNQTRNNGISEPICKAQEQEIGIKETNKAFYVEIIGSGYWDWEISNSGAISPKWVNLNNRQNTRTELEREDDNIEIIRYTEEEIRERAYTECRRGMYIEAISNGVGRWKVNNLGEVGFEWLTPIIASNASNSILFSSSLTNFGYYFATNSILRTEWERFATNSILRTELKREEPFTRENYEMTKKIGLDLEGEIIKRCLISIDSSLCKEDKILREKVKDDIEKAIHGIFDGFETLNKIDRGSKRRR